MKLVKFNEPVTFSNLLDNFFTNSFEPIVEPKKWTVPAVNVTDNEKNYEIELAVPGMKKEDFNIDLEDDLMTISCNKNEEKCDNKKNYTRQEFCYYNFSRSFNLTDDIDREGIDAKYENGVLNIILPKKDLKISKATKKIDIK